MNARIAGQVRRLVRNRGFGFIYDARGTEYFFHMSAVDPTTGITFDQLLDGDEGTHVTFEAKPGDKGPRAEQVRAT